MNGTCGEEFQRDCDPVIDRPITGYESNDGHFNFAVRSNAAGVGAMPFLCCWCWRVVLILIVRALFDRNSLGWEFHQLHCKLHQSNDCIFRSRNNWHFLLIPISMAFIEFTRFAHFARWTSQRKCHTYVECGTKMIAQTRPIFTCWMIPKWLKFLRDKWLGGFDEPLIHFGREWRFGQCISYWCCHYFRTLYISFSLLPKLVEKNEPKKLKSNENEWETPRAKNAQSMEMNGTFTLTLIQANEAASFMTR